MTTLEKSPRRAKPANRSQAGRAVRRPQKPAGGAKTKSATKVAKRVQSKAVAKPATKLTAEAYVWDAAADHLVRVPKVSRLPLALLLGIEAARDTLFENTRRFADGLPANNALLWGARGMGKSSLVKAIHGAVNEGRKGSRLILIEIHREDIATLPLLLRRLKTIRRQFLLYCDDLSFDKDDTSYKSLKGALEGGIEGRPENVLFYATSNRRHLMPRDMMENESATAINQGEAMEERISLSDRFGLWLGFHHCGQEEFIAMIQNYVRYFGLDVAPDTLRPKAIAWAAARGSRSGRVAWQFIQDLAGELGQPLKISSH
ncbi:MAG: ATP-binding protein [Rhizomicrobium sp.]